MCVTIQYYWKCGHETYADTESCAFPDRDNCISATQTFDKSELGMVGKAKECMPCRARQALQRKEQRKKLAKMTEEELKGRKKMQNKVWYDKKRGAGASGEVEGWGEAGEGRG